MQIIHDSAQLEKAIRTIKPEEIFDTKNLPFRLCKYEKGEFLSGPHITQRDLLFLVEGRVRIYGILDDARLEPVSLKSAGTLIGDLEFCTRSSSTLFSEADGDVLCLALPIGGFREALDADVRFLHYLLASLADKVYLRTCMEAPSLSVEEKLLHYMKTKSPDGTLNGIGAATLPLRCSRRQLQRVLQKLTAEGRIVKAGKGHYRLVKDE